MIKECCSNPPAVVKMSSLALVVDKINILMRALSTNRRLVERQSSNNTMIIHKIFVRSIVSAIFKPIKYL